MRDTKRRLDKLELIFKHRDCTCDRSVVLVMAGANVPAPCPLHGEAARIVLVVSEQDARL